MMEKQIGKCALCGKKCKLSFEHIPPKAAFNANPSRPVSGDKIMGDNSRMPWDIDGLPYENQQRGMGRFSLCDECNNNTGTWYGNDYTNFARIIHCFLADNRSSLAQGVHIKQIYPLRIIKQVLSMFCSINNFEDERILPLRSFVLDKDKTGIDSQHYKVCIYFTRSQLIRYIPLSVIITQTKSGYRNIVVSEITAYPVGFILYLNPTEIDKHEGIDITSFSQYKYDEKRTVYFPACVKEVNNIFPLDYRARAEILDTIEKNKRWSKNH